MLAEITWEQFGEWQAFDRLDPFSEERADFRAAGIAQELRNLFARGNPKTRPHGWTLEECAVLFGDHPGREPVVVDTLGPVQSAEEAERRFCAWVSGHNAMLQEKAAGSAKRG